MNKSFNKVLSYYPSRASISYVTSIL